MENDSATGPARGPGKLGVGEREVVLIFEELAQSLSLPRSLGEIYGLLYAVPRPLAFQEIVDLLGVSKGSVSQGLRFLRNVGAVRVVLVAGERREFFEPVLELRQLVSGIIREKVQPQLDRWGERNRGLNAAEGFKLAATPAERGAVKDRLVRLRTWHKLTTTVVPTLGKLLE